MRLSPHLQEASLRDMGRIMTILVIIGTVLVIAGLGLLLTCIIKAGQIQRGGHSHEDATEALQKLIPLNMGGVFLSAIGLMCVVLGLIF